MATNRRRPDCNPKPGIWSTVTAAVQAGWGPTGRLLTVLAVLGVLLIGVTAAAGDSDIMVMLRAFFAVGV